jgi:V8-like Glu-specific endopeptidase
VDESLAGFGSLSGNVEVPWAAVVTARSEKYPDRSFAAVIISPNLVLSSTLTNLHLLKSNFMSVEHLRVNCVIVVSG